jgi:nitroreductase
MTVFEAIAKRHAVRAFRPDKIDEGTVRELLKEAVRAPSAMHAEPWTFAVIQDPALLKKYSDLAKATWSPERDVASAVAHPRASDARGKSILSQPEFNIFYDASTLIVICARPLGGFVTADCWLAAENLMLAACAMGLGTCCIGFGVPVLNRAEVKAELGIPEDVVAVAPIIVGVPREDAPQTPRKAPEIICWRRGESAFTSGLSGSRAARNRP